jgi:uncharacterized protein
LTYSVVGVYKGIGFEWDAAKSARNVRDRGLPFSVSPALFERPALVTRDQRKDYGEERFRLIGSVGPAILVCVYTIRPSGHCRVISLRVANRRERDAYRSAYPG